MMTISDKSANIEFTEKEYELLGSILDEKIADMEHRLDEIDGYKYIKVYQLSAKIRCILTLIEHKKSKYVEKQNEMMEVFDGIKL